MISELYITGEIGREITQGSVLAQLKGIGSSALSSSDVLRIHLNSRGGSVTEGWAIYVLLRSVAAHKIAVVEGVAASMGSVLALACDEVRMTRGAFFMIHNPSADVTGTAAQMRDRATTLGEMGRELLRLYIARTGLPEARIRELMEQERFMSAAEAVQFGFAQGMEEDAPSIDFDAVARARHAPMTLERAYDVLQRVVQFPEGRDPVEVAKSRALLDAVPEQRARLANAEALHVRMGLGSERPAITHNGRESTYRAFGTLSFRK